MAQRQPGHYLVNRYTRKVIAGPDSPVVLNATLRRKAAKLSRGVKCPLTVVKWDGGKAVAASNVVSAAANVEDAVTSLLLRANRLSADVDSVAERYERDVERLEQIPEGKLEDWDKKNLLEKKKFLSLKPKAKRAIDAVSQILTDTAKTVRKSLQKGSGGLPTAESAVQKALASLAALSPYFITGYVTSYEKGWLEESLQEISKSFKSDPRWKPWPIFGLQASTPEKAEELATEMRDKYGSDVQVGWPGKQRVVKVVYNPEVVKTQELLSVAQAVDEDVRAMKAPTPDTTSMSNISAAVKAPKPPRVGTIVHKHKGGDSYMVNAIVGPQITLVGRPEEGNIHVSVSQLYADYSWRGKKEPNVSASVAAYLIYVKEPLTGKQEGEVERALNGLVSLGPSYHEGWHSWASRKPIPSSVISALKSLGVTYKQDTEDAAFWDWSDFDMSSVSASTSKWYVVSNEDSAKFADMCAEDGAGTSLWKKGSTNSVVRVLAEPDQLGSVQRAIRQFKAREFTGSQSLSLKHSVSAGFAYDEKLARRELVDKQMMNSTTDRRGVKVQKKKTPDGDVMYSVAGAPFVNEDQAIKQLVAEWAKIHNEVSASGAWPTIPGMSVKPIDENSADVFENGKRVGTLQRRIKGGFDVEGVSSRTLADWARKNGKSQGGTADGGYRVSASIPRPSMGDRLLLKNGKKVVVVLNTAWPMKLQVVDISQPLSGARRPFDVSPDEVSKIVDTGAIRTPLDDGSSGEAESTPRMRGKMLKPGAKDKRFKASNVSAARNVSAASDIAKLTAAVKLTLTGGAEVARKIAEQLDSLFGPWLDVDMRNAATYIVVKYDPAEVSRDLIMQVASRVAGRKAVEVKKASNVSAATSFRVINGQHEDIVKGAIANMGLDHLIRPSATARDMYDSAWGALAESVGENKAEKMLQEEIRDAAKRRGVKLSHVISADSSLRYVFPSAKHAARFVEQIQVLSPDLKTGSQGTAGVVLNPGLYAADIADTARKLGGKPPAALSAALNSTNTQIRNLFLRKGAGAFWSVRYEDMSKDDIIKDLEQQNKPYLDRVIQALKSYEMSSVAAGPDTLYFKDEESFRRQASKMQLRIREQWWPNGILITAKDKEGNLVGTFDTSRAVGKINPDPWDRQRNGLSNVRASDQKAVMRQLRALAQRQGFSDEDIYIKGNKLELLDGTGEGNTYVVNPDGSITANENGYKKKYPTISDLDKSWNASNVRASDTIAVAEAFLKAAKEADTDMKAARLLMKGSDARTFTPGAGPYHAEAMLQALKQGQVDKAKKFASLGETYYKGDAATLPQYAQSAKPKVKDTFMVAAASARFALKAAQAAVAAVSSVGMSNVRASSKGTIQRTAKGYTYQVKGEPRSITIRSSEEMSSILKALGVSMSPAQLEALPQGRDWPFSNVRAASKTREQIKQEGYALMKKVNKAEPRGRAQVGYVLTEKERQKQAKLQAEVQKFEEENDCILDFGGGSVVFNMSNVAASSPVEIVMKQSDLAVMKRKYPALKIISTRTRGNDLYPLEIAVKVQGDDADDAEEEFSSQLAEERSVGKRSLSNVSAAIPAQYERAIKQLLSKHVPNGEIEATINDVKSGIDKPLAAAQALLRDTPLSGDRDVLTKVADALERLSGNNALSAVSATNPLLLDAVSRKAR